jgi:hypothetical protein
MVILTFFKATMNIDGRAEKGGGNEFEAMPMPGLACDKRGMYREAE